MRPWMLVYSILFGLLSIFFVLGNFEEHYLLIFSIWSVVYYFLVFLGNLFYTFKYITPQLRAIWKVIFPIVIFGFIFDGIIDLKYGAAVHTHGPIAIFFAYFFSFLIFLPTFKAHYLIGYGQETKPSMARSKALAISIKVINIIGGAFIGLCMLFFILSGLLMLLLTGRVTPPSDSDFAVIAKQGEPIVQAIHDYQTENGLLPLDFSDLTPHYLASKPSENWHFNGSALRDETGVFGGGVCYNFTEDEGWVVYGDRITYHHLDVQGPTNREPTLTGEALFNAQLAEYEKRINHDSDEGNDEEAGREFYGDKIRFLGLSKRQDLLRAECERDAKIFPEWWLPQMALAESYGLNTEGEKQFMAWVRQHGSFANYWYLARYYRDKGGTAAALVALEQGAASPYEQYPEDGQWSGPAYAFDAAQFSYDNGQYELAVKLSQHCEPGDDGFAAAAQLKLMQFESAVSNAQNVVKDWQQYQWPPHAQESALLAAAKAHDTNFVYRPEKYTKYYTNSLWVLFYKPRL